MCLVYMHIHTSAYILRRIYCIWNPHTSCICMRRAHSLRFMCFVTYWLYLWTLTGSQFSARRVTHIFLYVRHTRSVLAAATCISWRVYMKQLRCSTNYCKMWRHNLIEQMLRPLLLLLDHQKPESTSDVDGFCWSKNKKSGPKKTIVH